jgi:hypothetical protein
MDQIETKLKWTEEKRAKVAKLEDAHRASLTHVKMALMRKNSFAAKPMSEQMIDIHCQALATTADLGALIDTFEGMGKIDRVDFMARCVERMNRMLRAIEGPN